MERRQFLQSTVLGAAATILGVTPPAAVATHLSFLQENIMSDPTAPMNRLHLKTPRWSSSTTRSAS